MAAAKSTSTLEKQGSNRFSPLRSPPSSWQRQHPRPNCILMRREHARGHTIRFISTTFRAISRSRISEHVFEKARERECYTNGVYKWLSRVA